MAKCDFGIGAMSAVIPPPNNLYVFINSILSRPSLSPDMINTGAAILEILESPRSNGVWAKVIIWSMKFGHFVVSGATALYAFFRGLFKKNSGFHVLNASFISGSQPVLLYVEEMITNFLNR